MKKENSQECFNMNESKVVKKIYKQKKKILFKIKKNVLIIYFIENILQFIEHIIVRNLWFFSVINFS
jgi:hypothetical protein